MESLFKVAIAEIHHALSKKQVMRPVQSRVRTRIACVLAGRKSVRVISKNAPVRQSFRQMPRVCASCPKAFLLIVEAQQGGETRGTS